MIMYLKQKRTKQKLKQILRSLRSRNGFYTASTGGDYQYTWLRDNFYCSLPELYLSKRRYKKTYHTWLDYYIRIEKEYNKFSSLINKKRIDHSYEFPHVKLNLDLTEMTSGWNHLQFDTIGEFLYGIALGELNGVRIIRGQKDIDIINKVIKMLEAIDYTKVPECGAWEENNEVPRISSIGIILSGLKAIMFVKGIVVPLSLLVDGFAAVNAVHPKETPTRDVDLAQLFLLYPFSVLQTSQEDEILRRVEEKLLRENGVIRYEGDRYFNPCSRGCGYMNPAYTEGVISPYSNEAEWTFGFLYLGLIYLERGRRDKALQYYNKVIAGGLKVPELYYNKGVKNENTPLGWGVALLLILHIKLFG